MPFCLNCAVESAPGMRYCARCGSALQQVPVPFVPTTAMAMPRPDLEGIGGWLILLAFALAIAPLITARTIIKIDLPAFLGHGAFAHHFAGLVLLIKSMVTLVGLTVLNYLFYAKRRIFPVANMIYFGWLLLIG